MDSRFDMKSVRGAMGSKYLKSEKQKKLELKICGIRRLQDIEILNIHKPDYAGFVFAGSKRKVSPKEVVMMSSTLDVSIKKVGVFVDETIENILEIAYKTGLDCIQLHGDESVEFCRRLKESLPVRIWKALRIKNANSLKEIINYSHVDRILLDTFHADVYGGTGTPFDWLKVSEALDTANCDRSKIILAGGLNSSNLQSAVNIMRPKGVDVSSGVEKNGYKDKGLVQEFVELARRF